MAPRKTTRQFVIDARKTHGDKYGYSRSVYKGASIDVTVTCRDHGDFSICASDHLKGRGCQECGKIARAKKISLSKNEFTKRARAIHGNKYGYANVMYANLEKEVSITCRKHGDFMQKPANHLAGHGCQRCKSEGIKARKADTQEDFIRKSVAVHGTKYTYSKAAYRSSTEKVVITCKIHGDFLQRARDHVAGSGCPQCGVIAAGEKHKSETQEFISRAVTIHGDRYIYDKVDYKGWHTSILIGCKKHGYFSQKPPNHLNGHGCPSCKASLGERNVALALGKLGLKYKTEIAFDDCIDRDKLRFDFQVFIGKKFVLLEVDGLQHFEPVKVFGGIKKLEDTKRRDAIKAAWARDKGIDLYRLNHKDMNLTQAALQEKIRSMFGIKNIINTQAGPQMFIIKRS